MKKTLSILFVAALAAGASLSAKPLTIKVIGGSTSILTGALARGATLYNTSTMGIVVYDENETTIPPLPAPFDLSEGMGVKNYQLELPESFDSDITELIFDFTDINKYNPIPDWGSYLQKNATYPSGGLTDIDYLVFNFKEDYNDASSAKFNLVEWYASLNSPIQITGLFKNDVTATGYLVSETCDQSDPASTQGGIVFFNEEDKPNVLRAEIVPEPTTATLSLLALAGLAARRRRGAVHTASPA